MSRLDALRALEKAVEDDKMGLGWNTSAVFGDTQAAMDAVDAIYGSLDAARALHDAIRPGFCLVELSEASNPEECPGGNWVVVIGPRDGYAPLFEANSDKPARAWLLALIASLIDAEEGK